MSSLRLLRSSASLSRSVLKRGYAEAAAASDKLRVSFALPHKVLFNNKEVTQVNLPATSGDLGVLANHVPSIEQLKPGVVDIIESDGTSKQYFVSGGFATIQPNSVVSINAVEAYAPEEFSAEAIKTQLAEAQKNSTTGSEAAIAEAKIEVEILEALSTIVKA